MKVGILTFHRADNYGAVLQACALVNTFRSYGMDCELIDYRCRAIEKVYEYQYLPPIRKNFIKWIIDFRRNIRTVPKKIEKKRKCMEFRNQHLPMSKSVSTVEDRKRIEKEYDLIVTGSDQIWNQKLTGGVDEWYCFKKSEKQTSVVSYGASIGDLNVYKDYFHQVDEILKEYAMISVRENTAKAFLENRLNIPVYRVLDPTLLVDSGCWKKLMKNETTSTDSYIFYYDVETNKVAKRIAIHLSQKENLKLIHFNPDMRNNSWWMYAEDAGPIEFLELIANAKYIVTSSFHATVFSILFEKQFVTIPHPETGSRVKDLLSELDLKHHICVDLESWNENIVKEKQDYTEVFKKLEGLKKESFGFIENAITLANRGIDSE